MNRFWQRVAKGAQDECWLWLGQRLPRGYGKFDVGKRKILAHRCAYSLVNSVIPDEVDILHRCDNPPCVNPNHLFKGDAASNSQDTISRYGWKDY